MLSVRCGSFAKIREDSSAHGWMPQEFRDKFEAELNEGLRELGLK
ncbi:hypothetical protein COO91_07332 [Nostoc flagelliforme CCNUN1]|uniref:Uncharacterized protein n=1 Tax=Nostoc flagelliforme CCNUN1 TaxID=2038116 RepID=A0A2K8SMG9_9NOSO|nr:hypothetical protein COO91_02573 [Nostoc flagelliforme CCNUN1]AUB40480.1 hypothetical protein COO91_06495 [Nostoc flagelliforme CCNUN1]AUB41284.1 hypothetical protein COO91_07332 [Nostoc flagelliforme CCNUN1]